MRIVAKEIECIAWFDRKGIPTPLRFKLMENEVSKAIKIDQVLHREKEKLAGNHTYVFDCQSEIGNSIKRYQLKYELSTCKWMLFKM